MTKEGQWRKGFTDPLIERHGVDSGNGERRQLFDQLESMCAFQRCSRFSKLDMERLDRRIQLRDGCRRDGES